MLKESEENNSPTHRKWTCLLDWNFFEQLWRHYIESFNLCNTLDCRKTSKKNARYYSWDYWRWRCLWAPARPEQLLLAVYFHCIFVWFGNDYTVSRQIPSHKDGLKNNLHWFYLFSENEIGSKNAQTSIETR